jgi:PAS domain S-box-containing protein
LNESLTGTPAAHGKRLPARPALESGPRAIRDAGLFRLGPQVPWRLLFAETPQPMWVLDASTLRFLGVNQAAIDRYGYARKTFLRMTLRELCHKDDRPRLVDALSGGIRRRAWRWTDWAGVRLRCGKNGSIVAAEMAWCPIVLSGRPACVVLARDAPGGRRTGEKRARLAEREKAARAEAGDVVSRLKILSRRLIDLQESERRHIARELHDQVGQILTGLRLVLASGPRLSVAEQRGRQDRALSIVDDLVSRVRSLSMDLRPAMLDELGLLPALLCNFERFTALTGVRVAFRHSGVGRRFRPAIETAAFRIIQEALTNVARHAGVTEVGVDARASRGTLSLRVEDCGPGFAVEAAFAGRSSGLIGIRERASLLGGRLTVESSPGGGGTRLQARLPLSGT